MSEDHLVEFKCPKKVVDAFDEKAKEKGYANRSELLRKFMRDFVEENRKEA